MKWRVGARPSAPEYALRSPPVPTSPSSTSIRRVLGGARRRGRAAYAALRGRSEAAPAAEQKSTDILDWYTKDPPSPSAAVGIFAGEWASQFPAPLQDVPAGKAPLFADDRIAWCID